MLAVSRMGKLLPAAWQAHLPSVPAHLELNSAQLVACGVIALLTGINIRGVRQGAVVQNLFTVLKVAALVALIVAGLSHVRHTSHFFPLVEPISGKEAIEMGLLAAMAVAFSKALFAYDAWYTVAFVAEEVRDSDRTLPRSLLLGTLLVTFLYVLTNFAYLAVLPIGEIAGVPENRVAQRVAEVLFGNVGWTLVIVAILISTFGCINGMILGGARVSLCHGPGRAFLSPLRGPAPANRHARHGPDLPGSLVDGFDSDRLLLRALDLHHVLPGLFGGLTVAAV